jgi:hypothetical protein
VLTNL